MGKIERLMDSWCEIRVNPLNMTDKEIVEWMEENCDEMTYESPTAHRFGGFTIKCYEQISKAKTFRDAVGIAAAKWKELNS